MIPFLGYFSRCLQDDMLASTQVAVFRLRANLGEGQGEKCQPPLPNILLDYWGPKVLRQNRDSCPQMSSSLGVGLSFEEETRAC